MLQLNLVSAAFWRTHASTGPYYRVGLAAHTSALYLVLLLVLLLFALSAVQKCCLLLMHMMYAAALQDSRRHSISSSHAKSAFACGRQHSEAHTQPHANCVDSLFTSHELSLKL
jgi:hypothetical protein